MHDIDVFCARNLVRCDSDFVFSPQDAVENMRCVVVHVPSMALVRGERGDGTLSRRFVPLVRNVMVVMLAIRKRNACDMPNICPTLVGLW